VPNCLTSPEMLGNVRRFREYPECAVSKRFGCRKWAWRLQASPCTLLDTRDVPLVSLAVLGETLVLRPFYRACDTLLPAVLKREPMRMGYVGRSSETELGSWVEFPETE
jgi:hypothetical protein